MAQIKVSKDLYGFLWLFYMFTTVDYGPLPVAEVNINETNLWSTIMVRG